MEFFEDKPVLRAKAIFLNSLTMLRIMIVTELFNSRSAIKCVDNRLEVEVLLCCISLNKLEEKGG